MVPQAVFILSFIATVIGECSEKSDNYTAYRGCASNGYNNEICANWLQVNKWGDGQFIERNEAEANGIGNHNYCRNPGGKRWGVWCYQAYTKRKIYCAGVNDTTCVTRPEDDPKCPEGQGANKKSGTLEPQPEIEHMTAMFGGTLDLKCKEGCTEAVRWEPRTGLNGNRLSSNSLTIKPVTNETGGDWQCRCGQRRYVKNVTICSLTWTGCRLVGGNWRRNWRNSCGGEGSDICTPREEDNTSEKVSKDSQDLPDRANDYERSTVQQREGESADTRSPKDGRVEELEESCVGSECSFCHNNSLICGALGCLAGAITVVAAVFVRKSLKWKRKAKAYRLTNEQTMESRLSESQAYSRQTADRSQLRYDGERALKIEALVSQLGAQRREPGLSCSTSVTDTMHLRHLRQHNHLGKIQSAEFQSTDNIDCQRYQEDDELMGTTPDDRLTIYRDDAATLESGRGEVDRSRFEDAVRHRDGTLFDKYYDQDVEKWSIKEEVEI